MRLQGTKQEANQSVVYQWFASPQAARNMLNFEAIRGEEDNFWRADTGPEYQVLFPFIRSLAGPADYTPGLLRNVTKAAFVPIDKDNTPPMNMGTIAHEMSMDMILDQWLAYLSDSPTQYNKFPDVKDFLTKVPSTWDKTVPLESEVGEYISITKQKGNDWYVGGMTNWTERDMEVDFSFLSAGMQYEATIFRDAGNSNIQPQAYVNETATVTCKEKLTIHAAQGGGFAIRLHNPSPTAIAKITPSATSVYVNKAILYVKSYETIKSIRIYNIFTLSAKAQDTTPTPVLIGDLYYTLDDVSLTAETAAMPLAVDSTQPRYTFATITIPATVDTDGKTYSVVKIGNNSLRELPNLTTITIPTSVTTIGNGGFAQCPNLIIVIGSANASVVEDWAFYDCEKLAFFLFSPNLTTVSEHCFQHCYGLTNMAIPKGVTAIKTCAFQDCSSLKAVTIPSTVNEIDAWSFHGTAVESVTIPESVTSISAWTFSNNSNLKTLKLPASFTKMADWACDNDDGLQAIYIAWQTPPDPNNPIAEITGIKWWSFGDKVNRSACIVYVPEQYRSAYGDTWFDFPVQSYTGIANIATETAHAYYADGTLNLFNLDNYTISVYSAAGQLAATFKANNASFGFL